MHDIVEIHVMLMEQKPGMKKCKRGNGTMFTANLRKSAFN